MRTMAGAIMSDIFLVLQNQLAIMQALERIVGKDSDLTQRIKSTQEHIELGRHPDPVRHFGEVPL